LKAAQRCVERPFLFVPAVLVRLVIVLIMPRFITDFVAAYGFFTLSHTPIFN
jgi:hypothetical protein